MEGYLLMKIQSASSKFPIYFRQNFVFFNHIYIALNNLEVFQSLLAFLPRLKLYRTDYKFKKIVHFHHINHIYNALNHLAVFQSSLAFLPHLKL